MSNVGKIHLSPGRGLQKYRILGEDGQCVALEIEGRSGHKTVTTMSKYHFQSLVKERAMQCPEGRRSTMTMIKNCTHFRERFPAATVPCCESCHEDSYYYGMTMCYIDLPNSYSYEVCCAIALWYDEYIKSKKEETHPPQDVELSASRDGMALRTK